MDNASAENLPITSHSGPGPEVEPRPPSASPKNFEYAQNPRHTDACCGYCHKLTGPFQQCARCKVKLYCSRDCQKKDWPDHRVVCAQTNDQLTERVNIMIDKIARNKFFAHVVGTLALHWLPEGYPFIVIREFAKSHFVATGKPLSPDMSTIIAGMFVKHPSGSVCTNIGTAIPRGSLTDMAAGQTIDHVNGYVCDMFLYATGDHPTALSTNAADSVPAGGLSDTSIHDESRTNYQTVVAHAPKDTKGDDIIVEKLFAGITSDHRAAGGQDSHHRAAGGQDSHHAAIIRYVVSATMAHDSYIVISKKEAHESRASYGPWFDPDCFTGHLRLFMSGNLIALDSNVTDLDMGLDKSGNAL